MKTHITKILRKNQTPHEQKLWRNLRGRRLGSLKFRRQFKIGKYVADFCCLKKKLVIELDGGHHADDSQVVKDEKKQQYIESQGYKVLRFWNNEVDDNIDGILERILVTCGLLA
ncbi:MAG: endonuclease domain-containing protein [Patescibacteria group bacterium]|jgi:adenine-specific DNA-methyltransferase